MSTPTPSPQGKKPHHGTRLDPWFDAYAERAHNLRASEIRALFSVVSRPEVVSLAGGMPNLKDLPLDQLAASAERLITRHGAQAMQYGSGQGWESGPTPLANASRAGSRSPSLHPRMGSRERIPPREPIAITAP